MNYIFFCFFFLHDKLTNRAKSFAIKTNKCIFKLRVNTNNRVLYALTSILLLRFFFKVIQKGNITCIVFLNLFYYII